MVYTSNEPSAGSAGKLVGALAVARQIQPVMFGLRINAEGSDDTQEPRQAEREETRPEGSHSDG